MWSIEKYAAAWAFATLKHAGQFYGGAAEGLQIPYINHLASVAAEVTWGLAGAADEEMDLAIQCALLHDILEDTDTSFEGLRARFGEAVAHGVAALTKDARLDKPAQMADSLRRIQAQPPAVWAVKLADRISNLYHPPFYWDAAKIGAYREEAQVILDALGAANAVLARRLAEKIARYAGFGAAL